MNQVSMKNEKRQSLLKILQIYINAGVSGKQQQFNGLHAWMGEPLISLFHTGGVIWLLLSDIEEGEAFYNL